MWTPMFENLRRRMTCIYAPIFGVIIIAIVGVAYTFIWWEILEHEKTLLLHTIYHEAEEWVSSEEPPCSESEVASGSMLAYFIGSDGKTVVLNQLGLTPAGLLLLSHQHDWPRQMDSSRMLRMHDDQDRRYRYLAAVAPVNDGSTRIGTLYMFKNMEFYYAAAFETLFKLLCLALVLLVCACYIGYLLAGRNIRPIAAMYARQKQFTADASHEMRTPLAVLKLAVQGLQQDEGSRYSPFAQETLGMLQNETDRLSRLTENLMELARSDDGTLPQVHGDVDMTALCQNAASKLRLVAQTHKIELREEIAPGLHVQGDEVSLSRLLVILLDNAVKYSPEHTVITLKAAASKRHLLLEVADAGCGISDEDKKKIFDRFYRVDKARSRDKGGLGLGLSLALAIVRQHRGSIEAADNKPQGTVMRVLLPLSS